MTSKTTRERLDRVLVARGFVQSREQAERLIMAGGVRVNGVLADKQAKRVPSDATVEVLLPDAPFVSRGGLKLQAALKVFQVAVQGQVAMDVGASTGGFTDCLLQYGALKVYAVDVGYGQLSWKLRQDPRVVVIERTNIRFLNPDVVPQPIEVAVIDVSFISLTLVLPCVQRFLAGDAWVVVLVKPQFEVGKGQVGRGGIVKDPQLRAGAIAKVQGHAERLGMRTEGTIDSPVLGQKGNQEILMGFRYSPIEKKGNR